MGTKRRSFAEGLADPGKNIALYIFLGVYGLAIASDFLSDLIKENVGPWLEIHYSISPNLFKFVTFLLLTLLILVLYILSDLEDWFIREATPGSLQPSNLMETRKGLIVIMSRAAEDALVSTPAAEAIKHHWIEGKGNLEYCWILCGGQGTMDLAMTMIEKLIGQPVEKHDQPPQWSLDQFGKKLVVRFELIGQSHVDNPNMTFDLVNQIYRQAEALGIESEEIMADYTGGTKSMTSGMVLACAEPDRDLEFIKPGGYLDDGRADKTKKSVVQRIDVLFRVKPIRGKQ